MVNQDVLSVKMARPPGVLWPRGAPLCLEGGQREKKKVLLIKQALQALLARMLASTPQVRCDGDDDVSCMHRSGL